MVPGLKEIDREEATALRALGVPVFFDHEAWPSSYATCKFLLKVQPIAISTPGYRWYVRKGSDDE